MNINQLMKQAQAMQKKMFEMQEKMEKTEYEGISGGGAVKTIITGKGEMKSLKIDPKFVDADDIEMLEDLIIAAFNDAFKKKTDDEENSKSGLMGGLNLPPGMKMPF